MDKILLFNTDRCTGCSLCEQICSLIHSETCNPERSRIRILKMEQQGINIQTFCQQCEDAACIAACPVSAISKNASTGVIEIDHELCIRCQDCTFACPFKSIHFDPVDNKIMSCDLCGGDPRCAMFCETKAIDFLDKDSVAIEKKKESLKELERLLKLSEEN